MNIPVWSRPIPLLVSLTACGGSSPSPTTPSAPTSLLAGTWRGTVTIEVNPGDPNVLPPSNGPMQWTLEVVPQTNLQSFRATVRSEHAADDDDNRNHRTDTRQYCSDSDQHAG